jgi:hypothetical protein
MAALGRKQPLGLCRPFVPDLLSANACSVANDGYQQFDFSGKWRETAGFWKFKFGFSRPLP